MTYYDKKWFTWEKTNEELASKVLDYLKKETPKPKDLRARLIGRKVRNKKNNSTGTLMYSTFGLSVGGINEDGAHWQTLGGRVDEVLKDWELIDDE